VLTLLSWLQHIAFTIEYQSISQTKKRFEKYLGLET